MAVYRYQVIAVGFWRGRIKRWNTNFHSENTTSTDSIHTLMQKSGWPNPSDVVGACSGGIAEIRVYNASGGAPIATTVYFDWQNPGSWIPYTGEGWSGTLTDTPIDASGESALVVVGNMGYLSSTGKPVTTRRYLHAVPSRTAVAYGDPDVGTATIAALEALWLPAYLRNPQGVAPLSVTVEPYYGNHQRVRGRRRTTKQVAAQAFSFGVLAGGGATTSGQGDQFPGGEF